MTTIKHLNTVEAGVEHIISTVGNDIRIALPLGLGKPCELINSLYQRAKRDPTIKLTIITALSLEIPSPGTGLQKRFLAPFFERIFGGYPGLDYMRELRSGETHDNIVVHEFFFKSGAMLNNDMAQQNYISTNYTHASRDILSAGVNVLAQQIASRNVEGSNQYSFSCNPETIRDLLPSIQELKAQGKAILVIGQVNENLPFMVNDAIIPNNTFDVIIDNPAYNSTLFSPPNMPVTTVDHMIGLNASALLADGGTIQIGIGSLGDAIVYGCELREENNRVYQDVLDTLDTQKKFGEVIERWGGKECFKEGLYGNSEMFVDGFYYLMKAGILRKKVYDNEDIQRLLNQQKLTEKLSPQHLKLLLNEGIISSQITPSECELLVKFGFFNLGTTIAHDRIIAANGVDLKNDLLENLDAICEHCLGNTLKNGHIMHGGFFLGPKGFYEGLKSLNEEQLSSINMTNISYVNQLYGNETLKRLQRQKARFINTVFTATALGAATSDGLENGKVVSGVGGQYNFVAQAHELDDARSILMLKSTREKNGITQSNIVWSYGHTTIPRHLRDIFVTEYGIADVRGKCDKDIIAAMINIADSRFQPEILARAKKEGKLPKDYQVPEIFRNNTPERLENAIKSYKDQGFFPAFPCGTDFTDEELIVARCLKSMKIKTESKSTIVKALIRSLKGPATPASFKPYLDRMQLSSPQNLQDKIARILMMDELSEIIKP